ncbi:hypothetical protein ACN4EB_06310 [Corynebacterium macclintockiae]|uniref:hypothetical protein n=1 Tax=Corynebacterium macclintockiae TaxID=2913501 RepID=UPI003EB9A109
MDIPNPYALKDPAIKQQAIADFRKFKPDFHKTPERFVDFIQEAKRDLTPAQIRQYIAEHRHMAESPMDDWSRSFMGLLIQLGAKDLDITNAVDEMLKYIDCGGDHYAIHSLVKADTNLIIYNIHPKNFEQINRFLKATSTNEPEILYEWQRFLIKQGVRKKAFREYPGFHWIKTSAFAEAPRAKEHVAKLADPS